MAAEVAALNTDFGSIRPGDVARLSKTITAEDVRLFAELSGDRNPLHLDADFARQTTFGRPVAHGMLLASYVSTLVGMHLPGAGSLWSRQEFRWRAPVFEGDTVELTLRVKQKSVGANSVIVEVEAVNQNGKTVMDGEGTVVMLEQRRRHCDRQLHERIAFVSGSSRGIGAAIAAALAEGGATVVINYLNDADRAGQVCRDIESSGGRALAVRADVRDSRSVSDAMDRIRQTIGRPVDVLINNAAVPPVPRPFAELSWEEIQSLLDVQVRGAFHCCQAALPGMVTQKSGRIVNVGSVIARSAPPPQWTAFNLAKSALSALTRSLAVEFGPEGIRVNSVSPDIVETESMSAVPERLRKVKAMQAPLRRLAAPEDIARTVVFLCSAGGEHITGADIPVCGGSFM